MERLINKLKREYGLSEKNTKIISSKFQTLELNKGDFFIKKGDKAATIGFLVEGLLYAFYENHKLEECVSRFYYTPENIIVSSFESFIKGVSSYESIKALDNSKLYIITKSNLEYLYNNIPEMVKIGKVLAEESYVQALNRIHDLQSLNNEQRVVKFIQNHPKLIGLIPVTLRSSYLGVNRNQFSIYFNKYSIH